MLDLKDKLVEIIEEGTGVVYGGEYGDEEICPLIDISEEEIERIADRLIAHGVTLQNITDSDFGRWVPVEEKLPDLIPCNAGTGYSEAVNVLTTGHKVITAIWDGTDFIGDADFWDAEGEEITHWTPVLLPLPEDTKASKFNDDGDCCNKEGEH